MRSADPSFLEDKNSGRVWPVSVIIPAYGAAEQLRVCLDSLAKHLPPVAEICVADDCTPDASIAETVRQFQGRLPRLRYERRQQNAGFVENCNIAAKHGIEAGNDLLLLNSDTQVTAGFLEEMYSVLHAHERHGVVTPRSNNATIFSVPVFERLPPEESLALWNETKELLPRYHVVPTCCGFCMLARNSVLRIFGLFDPIYSPGYNEENDFVCRINRYGYSAVSANRAFVFHLESASFGTRKAELEKRHREILDQRYPEYSRKVEQYVPYYLHPVEQFFTAFLPKRKSVLIDLYHLQAKHCGSSEFALKLLGALSPLLENTYDIYLGLTEEAKIVFGPELRGYREFDEAHSSPRIFDLVFKPSQVFRWAEWNRMIRLGARVAYTHLDSIAIRCDYLCGPNTRALFKVTAELTDLSFTISESAKRDFEQLYNVQSRFVPILPGTVMEEPSFDPGESVLLIGNCCDHKGLEKARKALDGIAGLVVFGGNGDDPENPNTHVIPRGHLSRCSITGLLEAARLVVFPSFYEGFALPVLDALALGKHVVALDLEVNRELQRLANSSYLHLVSNFQEMRQTVVTLMESPVRAEAVRKQRTWRDVAADYFRELHALLEGPINVELLQRRWALMQDLRAYHLGEQ